MLCEHVADAGIVNADQVVFASKRRRDEVAVEEDDRYLCVLEQLEDAAVDLLAVTQELERLEEYARNLFAYAENSTALSARSRMLPDPSAAERIDQPRALAASDIPRHIRW